MKKLFIMVTTLIASLSAANAADLGQYKSERQERQEKLFNGFYIGLSAGGEFVSHEVAPIIDVSMSGAQVGVMAGYDINLNGVVLGVGGEYSLANTETQILGFDVNRDYKASVFARAGVTYIGSTLIYGKVAYQWSEFEVPALSLSMDDESVLVGGGIEHALNDRVSIGMEAMTTISDRDTDLIDTSQIEAKAFVKYNF